MYTHDRQNTPPQDSEKVQAHLESQRSTKPNKGSSASGQLLGKVRCVYEELLTSYAAIDSFSRKESVRPGITADMNQRKNCDPEDMIRFLLALCCQDFSSTAPVSHDEALDRRFEDCLREVVPIANSCELRQRLNR